MEHSEHSDSMRKPEFDTRYPELIFEYALNKEQWFKARTKNEHLAAAIDHLASDLDSYMCDTFKELPELIVTGQDVFHTKEVIQTEGSHAIKYEPLPLKGDSALYGEHTITGTFFGFHRGASNDLRVYIASPANNLKLLGGMYTPLYSAGLERSRVQFEEPTMRQYTDELEQFIVDLVMMSENPHLAAAVGDLKNILEATHLSSAQKLQEGSSLVANVEKNKYLPTHFVDALLELVKMKLRLYKPHTISSSSHHVLDSSKRTNPYVVIVGPATFEGVVPEMGLVEGPKEKGIALFLLDGEDTVQIPVHYLSRLDKTEQ